MQMRMWVVAAGAAWLLGLAAGGNAEKQEGDAPVTTVLRLLETCPMPSRLRAKDAEGRAEVVRVMAELDRFDTSILRLGVKRFLGPSASTDLWSKVIVLNRYVFAVPMKWPRRGPAFHSWAIAGAGDHNYAAPFVADKAGDLRLEGEFLFYIGPSYQGLAEFDYYSKTFGRRRQREKR